MNGDEVKRRKKNVNMQQQQHAGYFRTEENTLVEKMQGTCCVFMLERQIRMGDTRRFPRNDFKDLEHKHAVQSNHPALFFAAWLQIECKQGFLQKGSQKYGTKNDPWGRRGEKN